MAILTNGRREIYVLNKNRQNGKNWPTEAGHTQKRLFLLYIPSSILCIDIAYIKFIPSPSNSTHFGGGGPTVEKSPRAARFCIHSGRPGNRMLPKMYMESFWLPRETGGETHSDSVEVGEAETDREKVNSYPKKTYV